jgi:hypothetical protein
MLLKIFFLFALICIAFVATSFAQDMMDPDLGQPEQQTITLTRETVDALLQVLTPKCRGEMEASLDSRTEMSMECNMEIQQALPRFLNAENAGMPPDGFDGPDGFDQAAAPPPRRPRKSDAQTESGINPIYAIVAFVITAFVVVAALVMYLNSARKDLPVKPKKKLSKKKVWADFRI